ncbi:MAG: hypothetical protein ACJAT4_002898 [Granulosicoccus sp.]|jgi:hypothetical protein
MEFIAIALGRIVGSGIFTRKDYLLSKLEMLYQLQLHLVVD